jgi:hypothetical protein
MDPRFSITFLDPLFTPFLSKTPEDHLAVLPCSPRSTVSHYPPTRFIAFPPTTSPRLPFTRKITSSYPSPSPSDPPPSTPTHCLTAVPPPTSSTRPSSISTRFHSLSRTSLAPSRSLTAARSHREPSRIIPLHWPSPSLDIDTPNLSLSTSPPLATIRSSSVSPGSNDTIPRSTGQRITSSSIRSTA